MMADREKLIELLGGDMCKGCYCEDCEHENNEKACIEHIKSKMADHLISNGVTVRERGRWLYDSGSGKYFCSACDEYALSFKKDTLYGGDIYEVCLTDFCPNCGADMRGEEDGGGA